LLKVLSKPELDGAILMQEFLQIMENFGLYDDGPDPNQSMTESQAEQMYGQEKEAPSE
jgi:hypothetical protein